MKVTIPDCGQGVNLDLLPAELETGVWSSSENFRFRNGFAELWEGYGNVLAIEETSATYLEVYETPATTFYVYIGFFGTAWAKVNDNTDISPYTASAAISTLTRISGTVAEATTATAHNLTTGNTIEVYGATETGYNGTYTVTVMSSTVFRYTVSSIAANATVVGAYVVTGGSGQSFSTNSAALRASGGELNGILFINSPSQGLYYWSGDITKRFRLLATTTYKADVARPFKNYIVQLAPTIDGTKYPYDVIWSNAAEPGAVPTTFTAGVDNDAGRQALAETGANLVDCLPLGQANIIYTSDGRYSMQYVGGNDVFSFNRLPGTDGLLWRGCVANTPKGHVFITPTFDVQLFDGSQSRSIANSRVRDYLARTISTNLKQNAFLTINHRKNEVWVCFPVTDQTGSGCTKILAWNWEEDTWGLFSPANNVYWGSFGPYSGTQTLLLVVRESSWIQSTAAAAQVTVTGTLERTGLHFGDRDTLKSIQRSRWNIDATAAATALVYHGSSKTADGTVTYQTPATYTVGTTDFANGRATSARFGAIKLTTTAFPFSVRSIDLDVIPGGKR